MPTVIIISFEYTEDRLIGSIYDLQKVYQHFIELKYEICIISDIIYNYIHYDQKHLDKIKNKSETIRKFLDFLCKKVEINRYNQNTFLTTLKSFLLNRDDKFFIYYSGHGVESSILLPSKEKIKFNFFINYVAQCIDEISQIFFLFDCCKVGNINMTYKLDRSIFNYVNEVFYKHCIMIISSSSDGQDSISTKYGSLFTKHFFKQFETYNIDDIREEINDNVIIDALKIKNMIEIPTISIYTSYITFPILYSWIFDSSIEIIPNPSLTCLYLSKPKP